jgi:hypothetical protein
MSWSAFFGFAGDGITFLGGIILAIDAIGKQREFRNIQSTFKAVTNPLLSGVKLTKKGVSLTNRDDVELVFIRRTVTRAIWGSCLLALGFICLLIARIIESAPRA